MPYCLVVGCKGGSKNFPCQTFPLQKIGDGTGMRKKWLQILNRDFIPSPYSRICEKHFEDHCFVSEDKNLNVKNNLKTKKTLKPNAVPTLHLKNPTLTVGRPTKNSNQDKDAKKEKKNENPSASFLHEEEPMEADHKEADERTAMDILKEFIIDEESESEIPELEPEKNEQLEKIQHEHTYQMVSDKPEKQNRKVKVCHLPLFCLPYEPLIV